jgi:hypothetical protein
MGMSQPKQEIAMLKKSLVAAALLTLSSAALAQPPHWAPAHGWRAKHAPVRHYVAPRPAVVHHYYRPAPRPVYVVHRAPPPVVVHHHSHAGPALIFGAIVGAAVVHGIMAGH